HLQLALDTGGAAVLLDPSDLEQVVLNLVINARDALPSGGAIQVSTARVPFDAVRAAGGGGAAPGDYVCVRVADNGVGMSKDVQAHLFEPFFTTKEVGQGTGLGLAFVHGVAQHGGGFTHVDTALGTGTTVSVYLPVAAGVAAGAVVQPAAPERPRGTSGATILLVEDEAAVRATTERILTRAGYRVLSAGDAREASAIFD